MKASRVCIVATIWAGVCFGAGGTSTPAGFTDDFDAALKASAASSRPVVAVFSGSDWCGWCKKLEKEVFAQDEFLKDATNRYTLVYIDSPQKKSLLSATAAKRNPDLVKKYAIGGFPTVLVLDAQGAVLGKTGYRRGGGAAYLKHLDGIVANGPLVAKCLKPYRDEFEKLTSAFQAEAEKLFKDVSRTDKAAIDAAKEKLKVLAPEYRKKAKAIRKRFRAETIPDQIKDEKEELLSDMKNFIRGMRLLVEEEAKPEEAEEDDSSAATPPPADGKWHGIKYAKAWAECVQTNGVVPSAWKYFTEQLRPYVRRQLLIPAGDPFVVEARVVVDEVARTLWTPFNTMNKTYVLRKDCERMQALRDRGCSNLTVRALAAMADYNQHMAKRGAISQKGRESEPYRVMARELTERGTPLLRKLYADVIGSIADHGAVTKAFLDDLKAHPGDLRVVYNFIGSPAEAKEYDPWFAHIAEAEAEDRAAWKARGGGYASEVTEEGWKRFREHLAKARVAGEKAYQLHPELPESSYVMLHIVAPLCGTDEKDIWFGRVLEREIDNCKAWNTYTLHALPRWGGSVSGLRLLSDALWTIDRADLRYMRYKSVQLLVTADRESANDGSFFRDPSVRERYLSACSRVADGEGVDDEVAMKARKGIVERYWDAGEYEAAGKAYQELIASAPYRFKSWAFGWGEVHDVVLPALSGPHVGKLVEFERHYQQHLAKVDKPSEEVRQEARRLIKPLVDGIDGLTPAEKRLVYLRKGQLGVETSVVTDEAWHELPIEEGFPGWSLTPNARDYWKYADGAYLLARAAMTIDWASPLPADYELEMDVSLERYVNVCLDHRVPKHSSGKDCGCPHVTVTRTGNAKSGWKAQVELYSGLWDWNTRQKQKLTASVSLKDSGLRHKILVAVRQGAVTVSIDGEKAMEADENFKKHFALPRDGSKIKIGGQLLEIHGLRYRRLKE